jgi:hypothetical protein
MSDNIVFLRKSGAQTIGEHLIDTNPETCMVFVKKDGFWNCWCDEITDVTMLLGALVRLQHHLLNSEEVVNELG